MTDKPLTGRKVFIIVASAFTVIVGVNLLMASKAIGTFPGLEAKNSYVSSQQFDTDRAMQLALGWDVSLSYATGQLRLSILGPDGTPVQPASMDATLGRATHVNDDMTPVFAFDGRAHVAPADLEAGNWNLRLRAVAADGTAFRQRVVLHVADPA